MKANFILTVLLLIVKYRSSAEAVLIQNGVYYDLKISIDENLQESDCGYLVSLIKSTMEDTSKAMNNALPNLSIKNITIIVPSSWKDCGKFDVVDASRRMTISDASIRVGASHPLFGDEAITQQPRECGLPGDFVYVAFKWMSANRENRGIRLLQEWAKYRWGVFEEYGHEGDPIHPLSFFSPSFQDYRPTYCTNEPLNGRFSTDCSTDTDCQFQFTANDNTNIESSLMSLPDLSTVYQFCDSDTHQSAIPSKMNLLCGGRSAMEIIQGHSDLQQSNSVKVSMRAVLDNVDVEVIREELATNVVIAYDTSQYMGQVLNRFSFEKESIAQFITYEAPSSAKLGLVSFSDIAVTKSELTRLTTRVERRMLSKKVVQDTISDSESRDLVVALQEAVQVFGLSKGVIVLLTGSQDPGYSATKLAEASAGNKVWTILYPGNNTDDLQIFTDLASMTGGETTYIEDTIDTDGNGDFFINPLVRMQLSQAFRQILHLDPMFDVQQINYTTCDAGSSKCQREFQIQAGFEPKQYLYLYHYEHVKIVDKTSSLVVDGGVCSAQIFSGSGDHTAIATTEVSVCNLDASGSINITVERDRSGGILVLELAGSPASVNASYEIVVWASDNLFNLQYTKQTAPAIFVKVFEGNHSIVGADVQMTVHSSITRDNYEPKKLNDVGIGSDMTGNDGIYSSYLTPVIAEGDFTITITASTDNNGGQTAKLLPNEYNAATNMPICCGSSIQIPADLEVADIFQISRVALPGKVTQSLMMATLPPGMIKDLTLVSVTNSEVIVSFTAVGEDLDYGRANHYEWSFYNSTSGKMQGKSSSLPNSPKAAGEIESIAIEIDFPCDATAMIILRALDSDDVSGNDSNVLYLHNICVENSKLTTAAIVGISLGALLLVIIVLIIIYYMRSDTEEREKTLGKHSMMGTCSCFESEDEDDRVDKDPRRHPISAPIEPSEDIVPDRTEEHSIQIRSVSDLSIDESSLDIQTMEPGPMNATFNRNEHQQSSTLEEPVYSNRYIQNHKIKNNNASADNIHRISMNQIGVPVLPPLNSQRMDHYTRERNPSPKDISTQSRVQI